MSSRSLVAMSLVAMGSLGCNLIFGIEPGTLGDGGGASGGNGAGTEGGAPPSGGAGGASNDGGGDVGGGGGAPPGEGCDPLLLAPGERIAATCGIFVDANATTGDGTRAMPFPTAGEAFTAFQPDDTIYICGDATFLGHFVLSGNAKVYGGLSCDWEADPTQMPALVAAPGQRESMYLTGDASNQALLDHLRIEGTNGTAGTSSFGLVVERIALTVQHVDIKAAAGGAGVTPPEGAPGSDGVPGMSPGSGCGAGGAGGSKLCGGVNVSGGAGATCSMTVGNQGQPGQGPGPGQGGPAGPASGGPCGAGQNGQSGGDTSPGGASPPIGVLNTTYEVGGAPQAGGGTHGSGGGGGGSRANSTGGGGGSGGCGGDGGQGGQNGAASFALLVLSGSVALSNVTLESARGGDGSDGTPGLFGGQGQSGGPGSGTSCTGGPGGDGGRGGHGGAGSGGPSAAIAKLAGTVNMGASISVVGSGVGGDPGMPGSIGPSSGPMGTSGWFCAVLDFSSAIPTCAPTL